MRGLHLPQAACLLPIRSITHHQHSPHPQVTWSHPPARPSRSPLDRGSQSFPSHALLKPPLLHSSNLHLSIVDRQHTPPHPSRSSLSIPLPPPNTHPTWCHHPASQESGLCCRKLCRDPRHPAWLPCLSFPASPAAALHPAKLMAHSDPRAPSLCTHQTSSSNILGMMFPSAAERNGHNPGPTCPPHRDGHPGGALAQADCRSWLTQAQMPVSVSPGQPGTLQAGLKSGPCPWQVTPAVTQAAPVKLSVCCHPQHHCCMLA